METTGTLAIDLQLLMAKIHGLGYPAVAHLVSEKDFNFFVVPDVEIDPDKFYQLGPVKLERLNQKEVTTCFDLVSSGREVDNHVNRLSWEKTWSAYIPLWKQTATQILVKHAINEYHQNFLTEKDNLKYLERRHGLLSHLEENGVDNWQGYSEPSDEYDDEDDNDVW